ncbi:TNFAIP3-interacting protein 1 [Bagarius yarrelli]|uniref:TNFAIP3-interacting protein 1 n=1 Tax=Bagarius yarrelli TaxID=175774 RepID=A0A556V4V3_BAGYA|nr:TNFAIP3-interacting protein 1 [Bagarius yarrelli]
MDSKGPYRIYDPGGIEAQSKEEASSYRHLLEENTVLRERMKGLKSLGDLLEESQSEALKLRKRVEELVRDNEALKSSTSSFASACIGNPVHADAHGHGKLLSRQVSVRSDPRECLTGKTAQNEATEISSHFELVNTEDKTMAETQTGEKECLTTETCELKQKVRYLQEQLVTLTKQGECQDKEIQRLNRALEEALNLQSPTAQAGMNLGEGVPNLRQQELHTQIAVLKEQVKIFEEDFQKERRDRERMNEEKEDLRRQVERLQGQMTNLNNQLHQAQNECQRERTERCKLERLQMQHNKQQGQPERRTSDPTSTTANGPLSPPYCGPFVQKQEQRDLGSGSVRMWTRQSTEAARPPSPPTHDSAA